MNRQRSQGEIWDETVVPAAKNSQTSRKLALIPIHSEYQD